MNLMSDFLKPLKLFGILSILSLVSTSAFAVGGGNGGRGGGKFDAIDFLKYAIRIIEGMEEAQKQNLWPPKDVPGAEKIDVKALRDNVNHLFKPGQIEFTALPIRLEENQDEPSTNEPKLGPNKLRLALDSRETETNSLMSPSTALNNTVSGAFEYDSGKLIISQHEWDSKPNKPVFVLHEIFHTLRDNDPDGSLGYSTSIPLMEFLLGQRLVNFDDISLPSDGVLNYIVRPSILSFLMKPFIKGGFSDFKNLKCSASGALGTSEFSKALKSNEKQINILCMATYLTYDLSLKTLQFQFELISHLQAVTPQLILREVSGSTLGSGLSQLEMTPTSFSSVAESAGYKVTANFFDSSSDCKRATLKNNIFETCVSFFSIMHFFDSRIDMRVKSKMSQKDGLLEGPIESISFESNLTSKWADPD